VDALVRDHERLVRENARLAARVSELDAQVEDSTALRREIAELERGVARLKGARPAGSDRPFPLDLDAFPRLPLAPRAPSPPSPSGSAPLFAPGDVPSGGARSSQDHAHAGIDFGTVSRLTPAELDGLPYGLICLDARGRVVHYNDTEARMARLPKEDVLGRNFFQEVAPCTRVREFEGEFYELVRDPQRVRVRSFDFVFRFRHSEQHVTIVITPARQRGLYNLALLRRSVTPR
jgi:photoactive yellow protein